MKQIVICFDVVTLIREKWRRAFFAHLAWNEQQAFFKARVVFTESMSQ